MGSGTLTLPAGSTGFVPVDFNFYQPGTTTPYTFSAGTYPLMSYGTVVNGGSNLNSVLHLDMGIVPMGDSATFETLGDNTLDLVIGSGTGITTAEWISTSGTKRSSTLDQLEPARCSQQPQARLRPSVRSVPTA